MKRSLIALVPLAIAISLIIYPHFWVAILVLVDFYTPFVIFESPTFHAYHKFLVNLLPDRPELQLPEIPASEATPENIEKLTNGFTFPLVIRGLLGNTTGVQNWGNPDWWIERYGDEELLCGFADNVDCTVRGFFNSLKEQNPFYVSGASVIFERHPELHEMIDCTGIAQ
jgi:hypothetical protein